MNRRIPAPLCHHACRLYLVGKVFVHLLTVSLGSKCLNKEGGWEVGWIWVSWYLTNKLLQVPKSSCRWASLEQATSSRGMLPMNFGVYACCLPIEKLVFAYSVLSLTARNICLVFFFPIWGVLFNSCTVQEDQQGLCTMASCFLDHWWPL